MFPGQFCYQTGAKASNRTAPLKGQVSFGQVEEFPKYFYNHAINTSKTYAPLQNRRSSNVFEELSKSIKRAKLISSPSFIMEEDIPEWNSTDGNCDDDTSSIMTQNTSVNMRQQSNFNVKVCINFLRNLSMSEQHVTWYLVPDLEVLLDNLDFITEFIAGDRTCSLLTPAVVLAKLRSLSDAEAAESHVSVAGQRLQWLSQNSLCQSSVDVFSSLDHNTMDNEIVKFCKGRRNVSHLVIITKTKNLYDLAKQNDIHAYYLNALKIIAQTENIFLLNPNNTDTFKWPVTTPATKTREAIFVEEKLREFCTAHAHLRANIMERIHEWTCTFIQIMEYCMHQTMQRIPKSRSDPPCCLHTGVHHLKGLLYTHKQVCAILEEFKTMCGFRLIKGITRPCVHPEMFLRILGAGLLLTEELQKLFDCQELSECREMLSDLIETIHDSREFPADLEDRSSSMEES